MIYINIADNHYKFWGYTCEKNNQYDWTVTTYWGRIGVDLGSASSNQKNFRSENGAWAFITKKLDDKRAKGYRALLTKYEDIRGFSSPTGIKGEWVEGGNSQYLPF